jgi:hypothetical protein
VLLPQPDGPSSDTKLPAAASNEAAAIASTAPSLVS